MSAAAAQSNGLAVLGILIVVWYVWIIYICKAVWVVYWLMTIPLLFSQTGEKTNQAFNNILHYLGRIRHAGTSTEHIIVVVANVQISSFQQTIFKSFSLVHCLAFGLVCVSATRSLMEFSSACICFFPPGRSEGLHPGLWNPLTAAQRSGTLLPLQRLPDNTALLPERHLDALPREGSNLKGTGKTNKQKKQTLNNFRMSLNFYIFWSFKINQPKMLKVKKIIQVRLFGFH